MKKLFVSLTIMMATSAGAVSVDRGKIVQIYADNEGHVAIKLDTGFPDAELNGECPSYNGWVGLHAPNENLLKNIYHARETNSNVTVVTEGCEDTTWIKLKSVYIY
ncbi:hypothetical protein [Thalassotalea ganghwensis]